jgi:hypothetical protein
MEKVVMIEAPFAGRLETPLSELVQHVVNHGTYHRGNITTMLRQLDHASVLTDYAFYLLLHHHQVKRSLYPQNKKYAILFIILYIVFLHLSD